MKFPERKSEISVTENKLELILKYAEKKYQAYLDAHPVKDGDTRAVPSTEGLWYIELVHEIRYLRAQVAVTKELILAIGRKSISE